MRVFPVVSPGTVVAAAIAGAVGGAASTLVSNGLKNGTLTQNDFYQAGTSALVGGALGGVFQKATNLIVPASSLASGSVQGQVVRGLDSNYLVSPGHAYLNNLYNLTLQSRPDIISETANNVIPNVAAGIIQPIVQPIADKVLLPGSGVNGGTSYIPSPNNIVGVGGGGPLLRAVFGVPPTGLDLGCYNYGYYKVCVSWQSR